MMKNTDHPKIVRKGVSAVSDMHPDIDMFSGGGTGSPVMTFAHIVTATSIWERGC